MGDFLSALFPLLPLSRRHPVTTFQSSYYSPTTILRSIYYYIILAFSSRSFDNNNNPNFPSSLVFEKERGLISVDYLPTDQFTRRNGTVDIRLVPQLLDSFIRSIIQSSDDSTIARGSIRSHHVFLWYDAESSCQTQRSVN